MYQLSQSVREPPPSVTVKARFSDGISQRCLARLPCIEHDPIRLQQVVGGVVLAVLVLDAREDRELAPRAQVHLELADAVDDVIVDALGVLPVAAPARLPVAFEDVARVADENGVNCALEPGGTAARAP